MWRNLGNPVSQLRFGVFCFNEVRIKYLKLILLKKVIISTKTRLGDKLKVIVLYIMQNEEIYRSSE
jgi:hypothetical protein